MVNKTNRTIKFSGQKSKLESLSRKITIIVIANLLDLLSTS